MKAFNAVVRMATVGVLMTIADLVAAQQPFPNKPIHLIVPFPPGGSTNVVSRLASQKLSESLGQQLIVENRPGGNTIIGTEAVAKAPPDGYTILLVSSPFVILSNFYDKLPYDVIRDFAPVSTLAVSQLMLVVHGSVPVNTLKEFIALAKSKPGQLNCGTAGNGGITHLGLELLNMLAGIKLQNVPYKGGGPAVVDLVGGQVQLSINVPSNFIQHVRSGKLKAIAISGETRSAALPQIPTFAESGLPGYEVNNWYGLVAPAGTPQAIIDKLASEIMKVPGMPDIKQALLAQLMDPLITTPEQFAALIKSDIARYTKVIKTANIKLEN